MHRWDSCKNYIFNDHLYFSSVYPAGINFARRRFAQLLLVLSNLCHLDLSAGISLFWSSFILFVLSGLWLLEMKIVNIINSVEFYVVLLTSLCLFCIMANYISVRSSICSVRPCSSALKKNKTNKYIPIFWHFILSVLFYLYLFFISVCCLGKCTEKHMCFTL